MSQIRVPHRELRRGLRNQQTKIILVSFHTIVDFLKSVKYAAVIFVPKSLLIFIDINFFGEDLLVTEKQSLASRKSVATEKPVHKVNAEKPKRMFMSCEEYVVECHNIRGSNKVS